MHRGGKKPGGRTRTRKPTTVMYAQLRGRWRRRLQDGSSHHNFDLSLLAPNKFFVLWNDFGYSGTCYSEARVVGAFDDARDFLGFIRHAALPIILHFVVTDADQGVPAIADSYLLDLANAQRDDIDLLLGLTDRALKADTISESELSRIFAKFNEAFSATNPTVQVLAFGNLADILRSDDLQEAFEEEEDEKPSTELKALLDADQFIETNRSHLSLARLFLNSHLGR